MLKFACLMCLFSAFLQASVTVSASPLFVEHDLDGWVEEHEKPKKIKKRPPQASSQEQKPTKPPAVLVKKKTLLKTKFKSFKNSRKKFKKAATRKV